MRNLGSTVLAGVLAGMLLALGAWLITGHKIDWIAYQPWVDGGFCLGLCVVLGTWIVTGMRNGHEPNSLTKVGNESITMVAAVLAATLAVLTLTDAAVSNAKRDQSPAAASSNPVP